MKLQDIEQEALGLSESERAELVLALMRTLAAPGADITDEEVFRRDEEMEAGKVEPMMHEEFVRRIRDERGR
jgi:putative addiction module component (TIGR02574 family)